jgi:hypothetical protein
MNNEFTTKDLETIFPGLSPNLIHYWCESGLINTKRNAGRGGKRTFDIPNAIKAGLHFELMNLIGSKKKRSEIIGRINEGHYRGFLCFVENEVELRIDVKRIFEMVTQFQSG